MSYIIKELRLGSKLFTDEDLYPLIREIYKISDSVFIIMTTEANWILYLDDQEITIKEQP